MNDITLIQNKIYEIRGQRVMLDFDLAPLYQVQTKVLKQAVRRNIERFPADFMFEITKEDIDALLPKVERLRDIVERVCTAQIDYYARQKNK